MWVRFQPFAPTVCVESLDASVERRPVMRNVFVIGSARFVVRSLQELLALRDDHLIEALFHDAIGQKSAASSEHLPSGKLT
jgi:hypothetical protein